MRTIPTNSSVRTTDSRTSKPKLLFLKCGYPADLPGFLLSHTNEHVKCLSQFFDVRVLAPPCDYRQVREAYQPDLTLFEMGLNISICRKVQVSNVDAFPHIPKLALINADGWCETRAGVLSEMEDWGITTCFSISVTAPEHVPDIANRIFVWPNAIDPDVFHDYGESKLIPVLLTGSIGPQYPWRKLVFRRIAEQYPALSCPHHGYIKSESNAKILYGECYARTINASVVAPACGTLAKEVVRKHFEIPACNTCIITESSPGLRAAGFVDMQNCVFADDSDVLDKLTYLFAHPSELSAITHSGHNLVHSRHTLKHRDQLLQWFRLRQGLRPDERIIQTNPFEPLAVADGRSSAVNCHLTCNGLDLAILRQGDQELNGGRYDAAERSYRECIQYMRRLPEAYLRLAICRLYQGDPAEARHWITELIQYTLAEYGAASPDPVEWAYFAFTLLCEGKTCEAVERGNQFSWIHHPELERIRWVARTLSNGVVTRPPVVSQGQHRPSIHRLQARADADAVRELCVMLRACGQLRAAETLAGALSQLLFQGGERVASASEAAGELATTPAPVSTGHRDNRATAYFRRRFLYRKIRRRLDACTDRLRQAVGGEGDLFSAFRYLFRTRVRAEKSS